MPDFDVSLHSPVSNPDPYPFERITPSAPRRVNSDSAADAVSSAFMNSGGAVRREDIEIRTVNLDDFGVAAIGAVRHPGGYTYLLALPVISR